MKITLKTSENHSKVSENHSIKRKSEHHSNRVNFTFWGSSQRDSSFISSCPSVRSPLKWNSLYVIFTLFGVIFTHFGMIFTRFESDFHSVRVFLTIFTLLKSNHAAHSFYIKRVLTRRPPPPTPGAGWGYSSENVESLWQNKQFDTIFR